MTRTLSRPERIAWARLARTPRVGPLTFHRLIAKYRTASAALEALPRFSELSPPSADRIEAELDGLEAINARLLASSEPDYPSLLAQLDAPPPLLAVRGDAKWLKQPAIAIVGSREASGAALMFAERLAADLGAAGFTIVSGLARGLDGAAHKGALATGTIAVLAGGLDHPYPPQNLKLHEAICERGAVVSEAPLGSVARARDFPRRNSIISGLSRAVVIIEAALRSGSLITARAAADQGRDVMAVPGSPLDPRARGSNALIKQGATLIEDANDVIAALGDGSPPLRPLSAGPLSEDVPATPPGLPKKIAALLSPTPIHVNDLARLVESADGRGRRGADGVGTQWARRLAAWWLRCLVRRRVSARRLKRAQLCFRGAMSLLQTTGDADEAGAAGHMGEFQREVSDVFGDVSNSYFVAVRHSHIRLPVVFHPDISP